MRKGAITSDTVSWNLGVVKRLDELLLRIDVQGLGTNIDLGEYILALVFLADPEFVIGSEGDPATLADPANVRDFALDRLQIPFAPIIVGWEFSPSGWGRELLGCFATQGWQVMSGIDGDLQLLGCALQLQVARKVLHLQQQAIH